MNVLSTLKTDVAIEEEKDVIPGGGYGPLESGVYDFVIESAYMGEAQSGALNLNLSLATADGKKLRQTVYLTSGTAKGRKNFYTDKNGKNQYLPGFIIGNHLALLTTGKELPELDAEEKVINLYDYEMQKEVPTKVPMIMELVGKEVTLGVIKQIVDKTVKDASGNYVPTGETREENEIDKVFRKRDGLTVAEIRGGATEASFLNVWKEKFTGQTRNKAKGAAGTGAVAGTPSPFNANTANATAAANSASAPSKSLFA
jgi:hypothetical protein